jgi:exodeoxyribonuclease-3
VRESGEPLQAAEVGLPGQEDFGARLLSVQRGEFTFATAYCPNGKNLQHDDYPRKLDWFDALAKHLPDRYDLTRPFVIGGDFNICPAGIDSWNEEKNRGDIFHTEEERARFQALLGLGLVDLFRHVHPNEQKFSWWDYRGGAFHRGHGLRIDFLLANTALADRVERIEIDRDWRKKKDGLTASDHAPVVADLSD